MVDPDLATVRVRRTLTRGEDGRGYVVGAATKSGKGRHVRLTPRTVETLKRHRARQAKEKLKVGGLYPDQDLVFAGEGGNPINPSNLRN